MFHPTFTQISGDGYIEVDTFSDEYKTQTPFSIKAKEVMLIHEPHDYDNYTFANTFTNHGLRHLSP